MLPLRPSAHKAAGLILRLTFLRFFFLSYRLQLGPLLRTLAMRLLFFQILALTLGVVFNLTPDEHQVAQALKLAVSDCSEMTENTLYAINQVPPCHITPEEMEISKAKIVLYTKRFKLNATKLKGTKRYKMPSTTPTRKMALRTP